MKPWPERGKVIVAANPWPLAAQAKREGLSTDQFRESDLVPDDVVYVVDMDELLTPLEPLRCRLCHAPQTAVMAAVAVGLTPCSPAWRVLDECLWRKETS